MQVRSNVKAKVYGFRLKGGSACTLRQLTQYFEDASGAKFTHSKQDRIFFAGHKEDICVGVFLTLKDQKRFPELEDGNYTVHIHEVEEGKSPFDFNFFAIDPATGAGVYQNYRGSCSLLGFGSLCRRMYDDLFRNSGAGSAAILQSRSAERLSRKDQLEFAIAYRRETFEETVRELSVVNTFEYDIFTQKDMSSELSPLKPFAKLERRTVRFKRDVRGKSVVDKLISLIPFRSSDGAFRVSGKDESGNPISIDLDANMPDEFHSEDVDSLADEMVLKLDDITESAFVDTLIAVLRENPGLFGPEEDDE
jgi:hypothetical protein